MISPHIIPIVAPINSKLGLFHFSEEIVFMTAVNAVIVALAAMGAYDLTFAKAGK